MKTSPEHHLKLTWYLSLMLSFGALMGWGIHHLIKGWHGYGMVLIGLYLLVMGFALYLRPWVWSNIGLGKLMVPFAVVAMVGLLVVVRSPMNYGYSVWMIVGLLPLFLGPVIGYWNQSYEKKI